jgi:hypothetical protein
MSIMGFMSLAINEVRNNVQLKDYGNIISKKKIILWRCKILSLSILEEGEE